MSAGRFKSKDDYFSHRSGLAEQVIAAKPQQPSTRQGRRRGVENTVPVPLLRVQFCKTVESFEITGKGRFRMGDYPLDDALRSHLDGESTLLVNPLSSTGETAFTVVRFDLSEDVDHPFSKARQYADELRKFDISSLIEVTEGGKGHYHLWIFHEQPVPAAPFSEALVRMGRRLFGILLETVPPAEGNAFIPLPLQGESMLLQRRVFVNAVGKMIREQGSVLQGIEYCPKLIGNGFIARMTATPKPAPAPRPAEPIIHRESSPSAAASPPPAVPAVSAPMPVQPLKAVQEADTPKPPPRAQRDDSVLELVFPEASPPLAASAVSSSPPEPSELPAPKLASVPVGASASGKAVETEAAEKPGIPLAAPLEPAVAERLKEVETDAAPPAFSAFVFRCHGIEYGVPVEMVDMVAAAGGISSPATAASGVRGSLAVAGRTVIVLDIGAPVEGTPAPSRKDRVIVLRSPAGEIGLLADAVTGGADFSAERVVFTPGDARFRGMIELPGEGRVIMLPDMERLAVLAKGGPHRPEEMPKVHISTEPHVLFSESGTRYALPARTVREILPDTLPSAGGKGGMTAKSAPWRGQSLPVIDIRAALPAFEGGTTATDVRKSAARGRILVLREDEFLFGVRVEAVAGIRTLPGGEAEAVPGSDAPVAAILRPDGPEGPIRVLDPGQVARMGLHSA